MGVSIECTKTGSSIDMGYGGFLRLREKVADLVSAEYGKLYDNYLQLYNSAEAGLAIEKLDNKTEELIRTKKVSCKVIDFLFQYDSEGRIHYGACKQLLKVIGNYDDTITYGYTGWEHPAMFKDFKELLNECANNKCDLVWH